MGSLDDDHLDAELANGVKDGSIDLDIENKSATRVIENAVKVLLQGLGEDPNRDGLRKTPLRVAKALREGTTGYHKNVDDIVQGALFPEAGLDRGVGLAGGAGGLVIVKDIDLFSYCESCLLPFKVQCHIGYVPSGQRVVGLSKLSRVADVFAKRLQDPQRLADEICSALQNSIKPAGVAVLLQCSHIRFPTIRKNGPNQSDSIRIGVQNWAQVSVCSTSGVFGSKLSDSWTDFTALLKHGDPELEQNLTSLASKCWCPSKTQEALTDGCWSAATIAHLAKEDQIQFSIKRYAVSSKAMIAAVTSILHSFGEDPLRKELVGTPQRFVQWLMNFSRRNMKVKPNHLRIRKKTEIPCYDRNQIHSVLNLPFWSQCEHHLLPFHGLVHVGFLNSKREVTDRSLLQSIVQFHASKLQVQERLTREIAETAASMFCDSVMVVAEASHMCMISRGIEKVGSSTTTIAVIGHFAANPEAKALFFQAISRSRL